MDLGDGDEDEMREKGKQAVLDVFKMTVERLKGDATNG